MSVFRLSGFIVDFISVPVTSAFTSATSLIIIGSQLKNLLGLEYSAKEFMTSIYMLIERIDQSVKWDAILAVGCCVFLLVLRVSINIEFDSCLYNCAKFIQIYLFKKHFVTFVCHLNLHSKSKKSK